MANIPSVGAIALALPLIAGFESFRASPYLCPAGKWTIGYGTTHYPDGRAVAQSDTKIGRDIAMEYLRATLSRTDTALRPLLKRAPTENQYAAMLSLAYNIGLGGFECSTLLVKFNAGDIAGAADEFLKWDKAHIGGKPVVLPGLANRRKAERKLFLGDGQ